jgi:hypothetical protein
MLRISLATMLASTVALVLVAGGITLGYVTAAEAHSGGTNSAGCHTRHSDGSYHCHGGKSSRSSSGSSYGAVSYCHVVNGSYRCGYAKSSCASLKRKFGGYCTRQ